MSSIGFALPPPELRQGDQLDRLHLFDDALEPFGVVAMRHDAKDGRDEVAARLEDAIDAFHRLALVSFGPRGIEEHLLRLAEITQPCRHRDVHVVVVGRDHQRDVLGVEGRHFQNRGIITQVQHAADVERVVIGPGNFF